MNFRPTRQAPETTATFTGPTDAGQPGRPAKRTRAALALAFLALVASRRLLLAGDGIWTSEGPELTPVYSLGLGEGGTLIAATSNGLLRSAEPGLWTAVAGAHDFSLGTIAVDPLDTRIIFASSSDGLFKSTDNGENFNALAGLSLQLRGAIAIDPTTPSRVYAGAGGFVYRSDDSGTTWKPLATNLLVNAVASLIVDPRTPDTLYAGADVFEAYDYPGYPDPTPPPGNNYALIRSTDSGATWKPVLDRDRNQDGLLFSALAVDPQSGTIFSGNATIIRGTDSATIWARLPIGLGIDVYGVSAIVFDPVNPQTMYAGTQAAGVFRSLDGGLHWAPMNDGLEDGLLGSNDVHSGLTVHSLLFDPKDGVLRAGTDNGVFAIRPSAPSFPCSAGAQYLCLAAGRYRVTTLAEAPLEAPARRATVIQNTDRFGSFSFPAITGDAEFPEVVVKIAAPGAGRAAWVFYGGLTNLPYILSVTDTMTGAIETYTNNPANLLCGGADTGAFSGSISIPGARTATPQGSLGAEKRTPAPFEVLRLLGNRFEVTLTASKSGTETIAPGTAVSETDRYGYFSLPTFTGDPTFPEVFVKMVLEGGEVWLFHTGLTSLPYTLTVTDTTTGAIKTYSGAGDFCAGADTSAFSAAAGPWDYARN